MKKSLNPQSGIVVGYDGSIFVFDNPVISITNRYDCKPTIEIDAHLVSQAKHRTVFLYEAVADDLLSISEPEDGKECDLYKRHNVELSVSRILKSGPYTHVFWEDGTKTSVRLSPNEPDNDYAAFTAALAIKMYGSNSALKRMLKQKVEVQKPKGKKQDAQTYKAKSFFDLCHDQNRERVNLISPENRDEQKDCGECCPIDFEKIERELALANAAKTSKEASEHITSDMTGNAT